MKQRFVFIVLMAIALAITGLINTISAQVIPDTLVVQTDIGQYVTDANFEKIFDKYTAKAGEGVNKLLSSIKENFTDEAEFVWKSYVEHYKVGFYISLFFLGLSLMFVTLGILMSAAWKIDRDEGTGVVTVISIIMLIGSLISVGCTLGQFLVPEYHVIQDLLGLLR